MIFPEITYFDNTKNKVNVKVLIKDKGKKIITTGEALSIINYNPIYSKEYTIKRIKENSNIGNYYL